MLVKQMTVMLSLIDADIVAYRCAAASENDPLEIAVVRTNELMHRIIHDTGATEYEAYLSGTDSYRKALDPTYKANRTQERPRWLEHLREHLITHWKASVTQYIEADDALGIGASRCAYNDQAWVVASIDKDLKQLYGKHYNFVKNEWDFVSPLDAIKLFYKQMLIGDRSDNVFGVAGVGVVKAGRAIDPLYEENDMFELVWNMYSDKQRFFTNAQLLWILKQSDNPQEVLLHFLSLQLPDEAAKLLSSLISPEMHDLGLEPIVPQTTTAWEVSGCQ